MKASNGSVTVEIERGDGVFRVGLDSTQYQESALDMLAAQLQSQPQPQEQQAQPEASAQPRITLVRDDDQHLIVSYPLQNSAASLAAAAHSAKTRLDRLRLAARCSALVGLQHRFKIPFVHPEALFIVGDRLVVTHFGYRDALAPIALDDAEFLKQYKALIHIIMGARGSFEDNVNGAVATNDRFEQSVNACSSATRCAALIDQELAAEEETAGRKFALVPKSRYRFFMIFGSVAIILALVLGGFTYYYAGNNRKQDAIITAQTSFLTGDYAQAQSDLQRYSPKSLPKSARYVLAVSAINLTDLTQAQKQAILDNISVKSDDNTLNYWIYTGRGDFSNALDLAQNLGDDQLTLLAYINLYESTKLNSTMDGAKKQQLLGDYSKKIAELSKTLKQ